MIFYLLFDGFFLTLPIIYDYISTCPLHDNRYSSLYIFPAYPFNKRSVCGFNLVKPTEQSIAELFFVFFHS
jgi:hypothetical protein